MRKTLSLLLVSVLFLCWLTAAAEDNGILGHPFPDFTVQDVDGNTFTLSEALKDHEAVLISLWSTRCPLCRLESPFLNEAYEQYGDRAAFISLFTEPDDTPETIREFRRSLGLSLPMGRDEDMALYGLIASGSTVPASVAVDRFGNAVFFHNTFFKSTREVTSVLDAILGEDYSETVVLDGIPAPKSTAVFPVSSARGIFVENRDAKQIFFRSEAPAYRLEAYVVNDDTAHLRMEIPASDDPYGMVLYHANADYVYELAALLDPDRDSFVIDIPMPRAEDEIRIADVCLYEFPDPDSPDSLHVCLIPSEDCLDELCETLLPRGWVLSEGGADESAAQDAPQAYILHVVDQYGAPVPGVMANFCTDTSCTVAFSDENGTITFDGTPDVYHVQLLKVPDGYSFDAGFDMYTGSTYGEWVLHIAKG